MKYMRWFPASAARTWRFRWSAWNILRAEPATHWAFRHAAAAGRSRAIIWAAWKFRGRKHRCSRAIRTLRKSCRNRRATSGTVVYRPVTVIDASEPKRLDLRVEIPVEDMTRLDEVDLLPSGPASQGPVRPSIWSAIHPKLLELVRSHRSTLIFVNSRRLAERISGAHERSGRANFSCARITAAWPWRSARKLKTA